MRLFFLFALFLSSCANREPLDPRASFDLECPEEKLRYTELNEDSWGVRGCGKQATYMWICNTKGYFRSGAVLVPSKKCQWVRN